MAQTIVSTPCTVRFSGNLATKSQKVATPLSAANASFVGSSARLSQNVTTNSIGRTALSVTARDAAWAPGSKAPDHLDGSLAGDFGFDPLGLGKDPEKMVWYRQAELVHARFAMLGAAGVLVPEALSMNGLSFAGDEPVPWYEAGEYEYFAATRSIFAVQVFMMGWAEGRRWLDIKNPGSVNQDPAFRNNSLPENPVGYPGGIFDPFGWSKGDLAALQLKEIKNGRLAMLAMLGFYVQAATVGGTPIENWLTHINDPWNTTLLSNFSDVFVWDYANPSAAISEFAPNL